MTTTHDTILYSSSLLTIGLFDCPRDSPDFADTGPIRGHLLAFPRTSVKIRHENMREAFVADPNTVTIYNEGQAYERIPLSEYGDRCDWLAMCPELLCELLTDLDIKYNEDPKNIFRITHGLSPAKAYANFRRLVNNLMAYPHADAISAEEQALAILRETIAQTHRQSNLISRGKKRPSTSAKHARLARRCTELLANRYTEALSLSQVAQELNTSPFHLSRVFRTHVGLTIHNYLSQLRLREALRSVAESDGNLATLSVNLGFSDHSHFSHYFRKAFGESPSSYRSNIFVTKT